MYNDFLHWFKSGLYCDPFGCVSSYRQQRYTDDQDFQINPTLMKQLKLDACPNHTPEGQALWVYLRLCQVLKYDEKYFYSYYRSLPNDDPRASFKEVENVTAETPTTCFNFSRIATKLLNQIPKVNALMIAVGKDQSHFRFRYYTDQVAVDAEPVISESHFNDMARVKLGLNPRGLEIYRGAELMKQLMEEIATPLLEKNGHTLQDYLKIVQAMPPIKEPTPIKVEHLAHSLQAAGVDGASMVQLLSKINHQFQQRPYKLARVALVNPKGVMRPQLLVRENRDITKQGITKIDLTTLDTAHWSIADYKDMLHQCSLIYASGFYDDRRVDFEREM